MKTDNFELVEFNLSDKEHLIFLENMIKSDGSELISGDIKRFVEIKYNNELIGLSFLNYHPEEKRDNKLLKEEIEIGLGILPEFRGKHLGSQFEKEFSEYLLNKYPQFDEVVARIENTNLNSINAVKKAGFEHIKDDEYHFKKTQKYK